MTSYADHVQRLADHYGLTIEHVDISESRVSLSERTLYLAPITDDVSYAVALHEIGHYAERGKTVSLSDFYRVNPIPAECLAWSWAARAAIQWTRPMIMRCFDSLRLHMDADPSRDVPSNWKRIEEALVTVCTMSKAHQGEPSHVY